MSDKTKYTWFDHPQTLQEHMAIAMGKTMDLSLFMTPPAFDGTYVQLGPGYKMIRGWSNLDYPDWDAEKDKLPFDDQNVDGIVSYHTLDHLRPETVISLMGEVQRVLDDGGWFINIVPHYDSELWHTDLTHKSQFGTETWRSLFSTRHYDHQAVNGPDRWYFRIVFNMLMGFTERNTVLVTKLVKDVDLYEEEW